MFVLIRDRSYVNKLHEIPLFLQSLRIMPKICAITETWLGPKDDDILFTSIVPEYNLYRADRQGLGGGVALLCHNSVVCISPNSVCVDGIESIWVNVTLSPSRTILIGGIYRKPTCTIDDLVKWFNFAEVDLLNKYNEIILMGDLKLPHINWEVPMTTTFDQSHSYFITKLQEHGMKQHNLTPTREMNVLIWLFQIFQIRYLTSLLQTQFRQVIMIHCVLILNCLLWMDVKLAMIILSNIYMIVLTMRL